jgi:DNA (cytosine-5)-methyltransferase 1
MNFGSVCSGIEAASVAFKSVGFEALWFSEIADFPSRLLKHHYPRVKNIGDMNNIAGLIRDGKIEAPDIFCGGTPCQAFSLAGWKKGLIDKRGQLTLSFIDIADAIDEKRRENKKANSTILWENVEGVLNDKTNAFGIFIAGLAGLDDEIRCKRWSSAGIVFGRTRNVAWRVLDAKYFGLPQQRRRLFVIATDKKYSPANILFETTKYNESLFDYKCLYKDNGKNNNKTEISLFNTYIDKNHGLMKKIENNVIEVFREYTDCLYSAYGTKWNGNAAAYNGSLYISQNNNVRRLTPLECERLMGFPDNYTLIPNTKDTNRYQAVGNSWPILVIEWIGNKIDQFFTHESKIDLFSKVNHILLNNEYKLYFLNKDFTPIENNIYINTSPCPNDFRKGHIFDVIETKADEKFYISSKGSNGILRRKEERSILMNHRLEKLFAINSN